jgi:hypothetical protein
MTAPLAKKRMISDPAEEIADGKYRKKRIRAVMIAQSKLQTNLKREADNGLS